MQIHAAHPVARTVACVLTALSAAAMLYIGLYQSGAVQHIWCPMLGKGCETVADARFARPFGIPDGYIGAALYALIFLLLFEVGEILWIWIVLLVLVGLATVANAVGVWDMARLGHFCFYCLFTTVASPVLFWMVWRLQ